MRFSSVLTLADAAELKAAAAAQCAATLHFHDAFRWMPPPRRSCASW